MKKKTVFLYTITERVWHWLQALLIILLLLTGFAMHFPDHFSVWPFRSAVIWHQYLGFIFAIIASLAFLYHIMTLRIKGFIPESKELKSGLIENVKFYVSGIFRGKPHPFEKTPEKKLAPIQKITYIILLNILIPAQIITGVLMWGASKWPEYFYYAGGLYILGPIHTFLAYAFFGFLIIHVYMITTGEKPGTYLKAMVTGYEDIQVENHVNQDKDAEVEKA